MKRKTMSVLFFLQKSRINQAGECPIRLRITFKGKRKELSTGLFITPFDWNSKSQLSKENEYINQQMEILRGDVYKSYLNLQLNSNDFDVNDIYSDAFSKEEQILTIISIMNLHNDRMKKLIGVNNTKTSYEKYMQTQNHVERFIKFKYKNKDVAIKELDLKFIKDYEYYLLSEEKYKKSTVSKSIQRFKKMVKLAISLGYIERDPFLEYKGLSYKKPIVYLNNKELVRLRDWKFGQLRLEQVRDMFIFCCYTGLAYKEMANLNLENLNYDVVSPRIEMVRQKTSEVFIVPLLDIPLKILDKYRDYDKGILPIISNQKFNSYLKEIGEIVGINKKLTHHIARKTFATTVLLNNGVPLEVVSKLLGHSSIGVTQKSYATFVHNTLNSVIRDLNKII